MPTLTRLEAGRESNSSISLALPFGTFTPPANILHNSIQSRGVLRSSKCVKCAIREILRHRMQAGQPLYMALLNSSANCFQLFLAALTRLPLGHHWATIGRYHGP